MACDPILDILVVLANLAMLHDMELKFIDAYCGRVISHDSSLGQDHIGYDTRRHSSESTCANVTLRHIEQRL